MSLSKENPWETFPRDKPRTKDIRPLQKSTALKRILEKPQMTMAAVMPQPEGMNTSGSVKDYIHDLAEEKPSKDCKGSWVSKLGGVFGWIAGGSIICDLEMCYKALWMQITDGSYRKNKDSDWNQHKEKCIMYIIISGVVVATLASVIIYFMGGELNTVFSEIIEALIWIVDEFRWVFGRFYGILIRAFEWLVGRLERFSEATETPLWLPMSSVFLGLAWVVAEIVDEFLGNLPAWQNSIFAKCFRFFDWPFRNIQEFVHSILGDWGELLAWLLLMPFNAAALILGFVTGSVLYLPSQIGSK